MVTVGRRVSLHLVAFGIFFLSIIAFAAGNINLRGSWIRSGEQWFIRIEIEGASNLRLRNNAFAEHAQISAFDAQTGSPIRANIQSHRINGETGVIKVNLAIDRPRNVSLVVRGLRLNDFGGHPLAYNERLFVSAPVTGETRPTPSPSRAYRISGESGPRAPENTATAGEGGPTPRSFGPTEPTGGGAAPSASPSPARAPPPAEAEIPQFPFPPPLASAFDTIPRELLVDRKPHPRLKDVESALGAAFAKCGYGEKSFYAVPDGFAMASRLEQMNADGSSAAADRWSSETAPIKNFSIESYLRALFGARAGHFRVVVFVITSHSFEQTDVRINEDDARRWVSRGAIELPKKIGEREYTDDYACTALIYEFETLGGGDARFVEPSQITGRMHLERSGLLAAFTRPR